MDKFRKIGCLSTLMVLVVIGCLASVHASQRLPGYSEVAWDAQSQYFAISGSISPDTPGFILYDAHGVEQGRYAMPENVQDMAWSPVASRLAVYTSADGGMTAVIQIWDMERREIELEIRKGDNDFETRDTRPHWSPDGASIAIAYGLETRIWDATTGNLSHLISIDDKPLNYLVWDNDSQSIQLFDDEGIAYTFDFRSESIIREHRISDTPVLSFWGSPDGVRYAVIEQGDIEIRDAASGETLSVIPLEPRTPYTYAAWDPSGTSYVLMKADGDVEFWDAASGRRERVISSSLTVRTEAFAISPDGRSLVVVSQLIIGEATPELRSTPNEAVTTLVPGYAVLIDLTQGSQ